MQYTRIFQPRLLMALLLTPVMALAQSGEDPLSLGPRTADHPVKYAIYSTAWNVDSNAGLRVVAHNRGDEHVTLRALTFAHEQREEGVYLELDLDVPAGAWAERETPYVELLTGNECVRDTLREDWRLKEISNYTLNPSVRGLIIEDTRTFRIFQCVRTVQLEWEDSDGQSHSQRQWVMYHFERIPPAQ